MAKVKVRRVGNSLGITLSPEVLKRLQVGEGDEVFIVDQENGIGVTAYDPLFARKLAAVKAVAKRYRDALKALA